MHEKRNGLEVELAQTSEELDAANALAVAAEERHAEEKRPETEAARDGRLKEADRIRERRARLVEELVKNLNGRIVEEKGWAPDPAAGDEESPESGRAGRLRVGPYPLLPERGFVLHDRQRTTVAWVRKVPTPERAEKLLREHGVPWEEELLPHNLAPVPEEEEEEEEERVV